MTIRKNRNREFSTDLNIYRWQKSIVKLEFDLFITLYSLTGIIGLLWVRIIFAKKKKGGALMRDLLSPTAFYNNRLLR